MNKDLLKFKLEQYLGELEQKATPSDSPRLRSPLPATDVDGFFNLVGKAIEEQQRIEGVKVPIIYSEEMPEADDNLKGEVITYSIKSRLPGTFEAIQQSLAMDNRRIRNRRPLLREIIEDPEHPGTKIYTYGLEFDNIVCFNLWAKTNKTANLRAMWFEDLIEKWRWYFEASGIKRVNYEGRAEDKRLSPDNIKLACRPLMYYVRTEKITVVSEYTLRSLVVESST